MTERPVFLDACVLYNPVARALLMGAAEAGLFQPRWSPRVLDEWRIAAARNHGLAAEDAADTAIALMQAQFPGACVSPDPVAAPVHDLPDPADAHVLAAALAAGAGTLLTFNLRDFPRRRLAALGLAPRHPDGFLWELMSAAPEVLDTAIRAALAEAPDAESRRRALKRAHLPRLAKAWHARLDPPG